MMDSCRNNRSSHPASGTQQIHTQSQVLLLTTTQSHGGLHYASDQAVQEQSPTYPCRRSQRVHFPMEAAHLSDNRRYLNPSHMRPHLMKARLLGRTRQCTFCTIVRGRNAIHGFALVTPKGKDTP
jgi:hypothetical protein